MLPPFTLTIIAQVGIHLYEHGERMRAWEAARAAADALNKPMLNVGCGVTHFLSHPCGDYCIDANPKRLVGCQARHSIVADVRNLSRFSDKQFGSALCSHVLEHLPTVADAEQAVSELHRVAHHVYILSPSRLLVVAWAHPEHALWVDQLPDGSLRFEQR